MRCGADRGAPLGRARQVPPGAAAEALQLGLELPLGLSPATRGELREALASYRPDPWMYVMLSPKAARDIMRAIRGTDRPAATLAMWTAALTFLEYGSNEINPRLRNGRLPPELPVGRP